jgi:hypothetical protein
VSRRPLIALAVLAFAGWFALAAANVFFGELNQDEGWYLYAARLVSEGHIPFRDFAFTQGPMLPLVYGMAQPLWDGLGVGGGRLLTALLGLVAALAASAFAARIAPEGRKNAAALLAFILIALNVYQSYFTTVVKTYSLCALFLTVGFLAARTASEKRAAGWYAWSGLVLAAAAATRITAGLALATVGLSLLFDRAARGDRPWLAFGLGGAAGLALFLGSFYALAPESFRFFLLEYHAHREAGSGPAALAFKLGMVSRVTQAYFVALALGAGLVVARAAGLARGMAPRDGLVVTAWLTLAGIALAQAAAPFPYDDYQAPLFPLFAALLAAALFRLPALGEPRVAASALWLALLIGGASAISSPINQAWLIVGRDRIWWTMRQQPALLQLRQAARLVRERSGPESELLTQDTYLAVEAGLRVPRGWEMGVFSYYPEWTRERAERLRVVNREMLREQIASSPARVAALSEYAFAIAAPAIKPVSDGERNEILARIEERFSRSDSLPHFGQGNTTLRLYERAP